MVTKVDELDDTVYKKIKRLCATGDDLVEEEEYDEAIERYQDAFNLLPEPVYKWEAATWILTALGETYFFNKQYAKAQNALREAMRCPDAIGNPFIHLRLGQAEYELGEMDRARDELARAYMGRGEEIFDEEDPKYLRLVRSSLRPPEG